MNGVQNHTVATKRNGHEKIVVAKVILKLELKLINWSTNDYKH